MTSIAIIIYHFKIKKGDIEIALNGESVLVEVSSDKSPNFEFSKTSIADYAYYQLQSN